MCRINRYKSMTLLIRNNEYLWYVFVTIEYVVCLDSMLYVLSFRMVFFYLVTTAWIFDISLCDNLINSTKSNKKYKGTRHVFKP